MEKIVFDSAQLPGDSRVRKEAWIDTLASAVARLTVEPASGVPFDGALEIMPLHGGAVVGKVLRAAIELGRYFGHWLCCPERGRIVGQSDYPTILVR